MTDIAIQNDQNATASAAAILPLLARRSIVLVGMMGVGKSSVGRRLAARLAIPFVDADAEIETAAGCSISEIFDAEPPYRPRGCIAQAWSVAELLRVAFEDLSEDLTEDPDAQTK